MGLSLGWVGVAVTPARPTRRRAQQADKPVAVASVDASRVRVGRGLGSADPPPRQVVKRAVASQPGAVDAAERAEKFRHKYWDKLQTLRRQPL